MLGWLLFSLVWGPIAQLRAAEVVDRIIAIVNNDIVTLTELNRKMRPFQAKIREMGYPPEKERDMLAKVRTEMIDQLIDQRLTDQEIKRYRIEVSEEEINEAIERVKTQNYFTDEDLQAALAQEGITIAEYREGIKSQMLRSKLVNYRIRSKIVITEEDVKSYYEEHTADYAGEIKYHLRNIIMKIPPYADDDEKRAVRAEMENVLDELKAGKSFAAMAAIYSESPLAAKGGDLGFFKLAEVSPQLREALKDLKPGEFTGVLDTDQGYQIFYVEEIAEVGGKALEDVRAEIEKKLYDEIINQKMETWLQELREESYIRIYD
jgi:peptidyl-prolyl cis-trans isomerase SurA